MKKKREGRNAERLRAAVAHLRKSKRTAVFLGAGASAAFGYPLTRDLLPSIFRRLSKRGFLKPLRGDERGIGAANRRLLSTYLRELLPGESLSRNNLPLVTALLSLLDFSLLTGQSILPGRPMEQTRRARRLLERAILEVIPDDVQFSADEQRILERFSFVLNVFRRRSPENPLAVITTNYDMAADAAVFEGTVGVDDDGDWRQGDIATHVDFGFRWFDTSGDGRRSFLRPPKPSFALLKLHGSTNWLRCPLCESVYINPWGPIWHQAYRTKPDRDSECSCSRTQLGAQIVSPSFVRDLREPNLLATWQSALDHMRTAGTWLIVGYSFPDEDVAVRALFTRAYGARKQPPQLVVVQHDSDALKRYEAFFGKERLIYCERGIEGFLAEWDRA